MKITHYTFFLLIIPGAAFAHEEGIYLGRFSEKIKFGQTYLRYTGAVSAGIGLHIILGVAGF